MCAKSVAVTSLCAHCFDKNFVFLCFYMKEVSITICCFVVCSS